VQARTDNDSNEGGDDSDESRDKESYDKQFQEMLDRFNDWADANGFERATNLDQEVQRIIDKYRIETGDLSGLDEFKVPQPSEKYSLLDRPQTSPYHVGDPVDPRAFDFVKLEIFAWDRGYKVTASTGGQHGEFSFHTDGRAIDVSVAGKTPAEIQAMRQEFSDHGIRIYDETDKSKWTENTTGFHLHVDTGTREEVIERTEAKQNGWTREDLGLGRSWPLRERPSSLYRLLP
jgi:hypothetical protein